jgi:hypothetical protein
MDFLSTIETATPLVHQDELNEEVGDLKDYKRRGGCG